ncbi:MAG: hypothetical protein EOT05_01985 [Candidatus Microsaccharimonas sossegonensis]|uniref:Uncharacterized protein n=1 Tax=Candidatus Microsaccharimonas sossegonensis TaxID=2506948 RepID=A0A4Q0AH57_9BACT|nr:MAG: hypothetical protein EOT05_01985 [Candidatus Microsaccharimonas sossegonensis]
MTTSTSSTMAVGRTGQRAWPYGDQTAHAQVVISTWLALTPDRQNQLLARLIAATVHDGAGGALERFAGTGHLDAEKALDELNDVRVPIEREAWVDLLGQYIITSGGRS